MIKISPFHFLTVILVQVVSLFLITFITSILIKLINHFKKITLRSNDLFPIILSYFIYELSIDKHEISFLPIIWVIMIIIGILYAIYYLIKNSHINPIRFYRMFWRLAIIYFFVAWVTTIFICAVKYL